MYGWGVGVFEVIWPPGGWIGGIGVFGGCGERGEGVG